MLLAGYTYHSGNPPFTGCVVLAKGLEKLGFRVQRGRVVIIQLEEEV